MMWWDSLRQAWSGRINYEWRTTVPRRSAWGPVAWILGVAAIILGVGWNFYSLSALQLHTNPYQETQAFYRDILATLRATDHDSTMDLFVPTLSSATHPTIEDYMREYFVKAEASVSNISALEKQLVHVLQHDLLPELNKTSTPENYASIEATLYLARTIVKDLDAHHRILRQATSYQTGNTISWVRQAAKDLAEYKGWPLAARVTPYGIRHRRVLIQRVESLYRRHQTLQMVQFMPCSPKWYGGKEARTCPRRIDAQLIYRDLMIDEDLFIHISAGETYRWKEMGKHLDSLLNECVLQATYSEEEALGSSVSRGFMSHFPFQKQSNTCISHADWRDRVRKVADIIIRGDNLREPVGPIEMPAHPTCKILGFEWYC